MYLFIKISIYYLLRGIFYRGVYMKNNKIYDNKNKFLDLLAFLENINSDEIVLDTDISYEEYSDDIIISDLKGYCEDLYFDDMIYYKGYE